MNIQKINLYNQLKRINTKEEYAPSIQIRNGASISQTNFIQLNNESANVLVKWLKENYK